MWRPLSILWLFGVASAACASPATSAGSTSGDASASSSSASGGGGADAGTPLPIPTIPAPDGWHLWSVAPKDCAVFVPDDLAAVPPLNWQPCSFMADGCAQIDAPWVKQSGWGFGGLLGVAVQSGHTYISLSRQILPGWWESDLWKDDQPIGAWRAKLPDSACGPSGPWLSPTAFAALELVRFSAEQSPIIVTGSPENLLLIPDKVESFNPPGPALIPNGVVAPSHDLLAVREQYGRFVGRWTQDDSTLRPEPPSIQYQALEDAVPIGQSIVYSAFTGKLSSIWSVDRSGRQVALLTDPNASFDGLATDGQTMVWLRSTGYLGANQFQSIELWGSPATASPTSLLAKKLWTVPIQVVPRPAFGDGWAAVRVGIQDVRLVHAVDGATRHLPVAPGLTWNEGQYDGIALANGTVWAKAFPNNAAGNDVRFLFRFDISKLPQP